MIKIFKYLNKKDWSLVAAGIAFIIFQVWLDLKLPEYMSNLTMLIQSETGNMTEILQTGGYMLLCALGSLGASCMAGYFAAKTAAGLAAELRGRIYNQVGEFSMAEINRFSTASLITRSTNDVTQIQTLVAMGLQMLIKAPITAVWAMLKISGKSWQWSLATAAAVLALLVIIGIVFVLAVPRTKLVQKLTDRLNVVTRENLTGIRVVRAYNAEEYQEQKFGRANQDLTSTNLFVYRVMALVQPGMSLIMSGLSLSIYWIGAYVINAAQAADQLILFSDMVVFSSYAIQIIMSFMMLTVILTMLPRAAVSANRINEVLEMEISIKDGAGVGPHPEKTGEIEFRNVSFRYPDSGNGEYVLRDISFTAGKGETVAFIGATGSGKSTLVNLIPRIYDVTEGEILVDGRNVKDYKLADLNEKFGYVPQRSVLFRGTIASNVAYGDDGKRRDDIDSIRKAVSIAQSTDFVEQLGGGYQAAVAQGGANLSGGQKQRLSIARAICREPEVYIFDDSFSALDYKTDRVLRSRLKEETAGVTNLIVAQRIGTIMDADKIIVLDQGEMAGVGSHQELMKNCKLYQEIAWSQFSKEELHDE